MYPFVSTIGYFTQVPSEFEVKAIEDGELLCFSRTDIERLSLGYPAFATCYQNVMLMIISKLYSMFAVRQTCKAEEFLKYLYTNHQWIVSRVPDKYIAQYMGVSDSWYCKLKKRILIELVQFYIRFKPILLCGFLYFCRIGNMMALYR